MTTGFQGRTALVTGGTSGIGAAAAIALRDADCRVTVTGRTKAEVAEFQRQQAGIEAMPLDIQDADAVAQVAASFESLNILVNCAGTILRGGREHIPEDFAKVVDVNLNGTMRVCSAVRSPLASTRGCVVNMASMLSFFGSPYVPAYSASKGGIVQLTRSLAIAWADDSIRVNAVAPGWIETALTRPLVDDDTRREQIVQRTPLGRWGQPSDVAGAILFLCSPAAAFITGVVLPVDGGYSIA